MSVKAFAKRSGITIHAVYAAIKTNRLSAYNIDGIYIIPANAVMANTRNCDGRMKGYSYLRKNDLDGFKKARGIKE